MKEISIFQLTFFMKLSVHESLGMAITELNDFLKQETVE